MEIILNNSISSGLKKDLKLEAEIQNITKQIDKLCKKRHELSKKLSISDNAIVTFIKSYIKDNHNKNKIIKKPILDKKFTRKRRG